MTMKERIVAGILASGLALALFAPSCDPRPVQSQDFPCHFEDEAKITFVVPGGTHSLCLPTDDILVGIFNEQGTIQSYESLDEHYESHPSRREGL